MFSRPRGAGTCQGIRCESGTGAQRYGGRNRNETTGAMSSGKAPGTVDPESEDLSVPHVIQRASRTGPGAEGVM